MGYWVPHAAALLGTRDNRRRRSVDDLRRASCTRAASGHDTDGADGTVDASLDAFPCSDNQAGTGAGNLRDRGKHRHPESHSSVASGPRQRLLRNLVIIQRATKGQIIEVVAATPAQSLSPSPACKNEERTQTRHQENRGNYYARLAPSLNAFQPTVVGAPPTWSVVVGYGGVVAGA
jgi:hypothetical protein